jgi:hypothetical protein
MPPERNLLETTHVSNVEKKDTSRENVKTEVEAALTS